MIFSFLRGLTGHQRQKKADLQLGVVLAFTAGALNAGGFMAVSSYTSHMTGIVSSIADLVAFGKPLLAVLAVAYVLSFMTGAVLSTLMINWARKRKLHSEYALSLMVEAALLLTFALFTFSIPVTIGLLCLIMGLQNAIITKISRAEIRTTHVTGLVTDIGIETGRFIYRFVSRDSEIALHPDKLSMHAALLLSFLTGGLAGAFSFHAIGLIAALPFSALIALIALLPIIDDIKRPRKTA